MASPTPSLQGPVSSGHDDGVSLDSLRHALAAARCDESSEVSVHAAVALVLREAPTGPQLLYIQRAEHPEDPWSGHMAFPGGRVDPEDISPLHAALRECREEVALDLDATSKLLGRLNLVPIIARGRRLDMTIAPFVFELLAPVEFELNEEVDAVHWVPLHRLINPSERAPYPYRREGIDLALPSVPLGDRSIWGLTLGMTDDLLDRIDAAPAFRRPRPAS